jgi:exodeoxyribonuclease VII large subunit
MLDPQNILNRGYSITTFNGKAVKDYKQIKPGDKINTKIKRGIILSTVKNSQSK